MQDSYKHTHFSQPRKLINEQLLDKEVTKEVTQLVLWIYMYMWCLTNLMSVYVFLLYVYLYRPIGRVVCD